MNIFIVDDDVEFLKSFQKMPLKDAQLFSFSKPVEAIKAISTYTPTIVISDVQMPGLHGLDFHSVVQEILKVKHFIYISANTKESIESEHGKMGRPKFFQKPLEDDFFDYLDTLIADISSETVEEAATETDIHSPSLHLKTEFLLKLGDIWRENQKYLYQFHLKHQFTYDSTDPDWDRLKLLENSLETAKKLVGLSNQSYLKFQEGISRTSDPWFKSIEKNAETLVEKSEHRFAAPAKICDPREESKVIEIRTISISFAVPNGASVKINDEPVDINVLNYPDVERNAVRILKLIAFYDRVVSRCRAVIKNVKRMYWGPYGSFSDRFLTAPKTYISFPSPVSFGFEFEIVKVDLTRDQIIFTDINGGKHYECESLFTKDLPEKSVFSSKKDVELHRVSEFEYRIFIKGIEYEIPVQLLVDDEVMRGFNTSDTLYFRSSASLCFAWEVAMGKEKWQLAAQEYSLKKKSGFFRSAS